MKGSLRLAAMTKLPYKAAKGLSTKPSSSKVRELIDKENRGKKNGLLAEQHLFSVDSANWEKSLWPSSLMPGQENIRLAKKGGDPPFPEAGFHRFSTGIPLPPHLFAETKRGEPGKFLPAIFGFGDRFLARVTRRGA